MVKNTIWASSTTQGRWTAARSGHQRTLKTDKLNQNRDEHDA